jgi:serine/threonine-protein kinase
MSNDAERWRRLQELFHSTVVLPAGERDAFLRRECAGDRSLAEQVLAMLREDERAESVLDRDLAALAHGLFEPADDGELGRKFGRYRVLRRLGEGGMGVVYLAEREELGGLVAIKVLRDSWVSSERRARFAKEQRFLASLEHPGIARLYDADTLADGTPYFVMEYVEGVPLVEYCDARRASLEERLTLFRAVCETVQYAHGHALVHRDLKSSNVLVKSDGSVRLLDFGIAKQLSLEEAAAGAETTRGLMFMTPAYAAPEQLAKGSIGLYTDIYSLGVLLYRLLTGCLPFDVGNRSASEAVSIVVERTPVKPSLQAKARRERAETGGVTATRSAWADLDVLVLKAMHKEPEQRYRTVDALSRDLDHFLKHEPLEARPDSLGYRVGKFVRRQRLPLALATTALVTLIALVVFFTARLTRARNAALAEVARTQRVERFMERLFEGGDDETLPSDELRVVTLVERGAREARALDHDPSIQAELFHTLGAIYGDLGRFDEGNALLRAALEKRRALFGAQSLEVAETEVALAILRNDEARFDEGEKLARSALAIAEREPADHPLRARAESTLARILLNRGDYAGAVPLLKTASDRLERRGDQAFELSSTLGDWSNAEFYLGHYALAKELTLRGLRIDRRVLGDKHANVASDLINLANIEEQFGHYAESERLEREALPITEAWFGPKHFFTASNLGLLARALIHEARQREALELLERAVAIDEAALPAEHPKLSILLHDRGTALLELGRVDAAEADFTRMLAIERAVHGETHERVGMALADLASVAAARKDYAKAESGLRQALALYVKRLPPDHPRIGEGHVALGHVLLGAQRYAEAEKESSTGFELLRARGAEGTQAAAVALRDLAAERAGAAAGRHR